MHSTRQQRPVPGPVRGSYPGLPDTPGKNTAMVLGLSPWQVSTEASVCLTARDFPSQSQAHGTFLRIVCPLTWVMSSSSTEVVFIMLRKVVMSHRYGSASATGKAQSGLASFKVSERLLTLVIQDVVT